MYIWMYVYFIVALYTTTATGHAVTFGNQPKYRNDLLSSRLSVEEK